MTPANDASGDTAGAGKGNCFARMISGLNLPVAASLLAAGAALRVALLPKASVSPSMWILAVLAGIPADAGLAILLSPAPLAAFRKGGRARLVASSVAYAVAAFELLAEYFYFDEFGTRFDQVVLDYIFYTGEVTGNVFESYPVVPLAALCLAFGAGVVFLGRRFQPPRHQGVPFRTRIAWIALGATLFAGAVFVHPPFPDRTTRELSRNGVASLAEAAFTGELDYASHYSTMDAPLERLRDALSQEPGFAGFTEDKGIRRKVETGRPLRRPDVVLLIAESMGTELTALDPRKEWKSSKAPSTPDASPDGVAASGEKTRSGKEGGAGTAGGSLSPNFDRLVSEGTLYHRFYATGTRTARALEGALTSFPPLPGNAIVRLRSQRRLDSLASVLAFRGYDTRFLYGGDLDFDNMSSFLKATGFAESREDVGKDAPGSFSTSWGAADEFVLDEVAEELKRAKAKGRPAFITVLTVSNHRPFLFPEGRVSGAPQKKRAGAARYADEAIGRFFQRLKDEGLRQGTLVALVGDHGPRSYTRARMPADAHRVPFFLWGDESLVDAGKRPGAIGSTMDVAPTILGILGGEYEAAFFGRDLGRERDGEGMAPMQDKQDVAIRVQGGVSILGFNGADRFRPLDDSDEPLGDEPPSGKGHRGAGGEDAHRLDAIALFQSAHQILNGGDGAADGQ